MMEQKTIAFTKRPSFTGKISQQKGAVAFSLLVAVLACTLMICLALFTGNIFLALSQPALFVLAGTLHNRRLQRDFDMLTATEKWLYSACIAATILVLLGGSWFWGVVFPVVTLVAAPAAFLLPLAFSELWRMYVNISFETPKFWELTNEMDNTFPAIYITGVPLRFKILDDEEGAAAGTIQAKALHRMKLAEAFCDIVQKQNKKGEHKISLYTEEQKPIRWAFFTNDQLVWKRNLDPNLSIQKNNLRKNDVVYVQRMWEEEVITENEAQIKTS